MPCGLRPDPTNACDFVGAVGAQVKVKVEATGPVTIFEAKFNGAVLNLSADKKSTNFQIPAAGGAH